MKEIKELIANIRNKEVKYRIPSKIEGYSGVMYEYPNYLYLLQLVKEASVRKKLVNIFQEIDNYEQLLCVCEALQETEAKDLADFFLSLLNNDSRIEVRECALIALARIGFKSEVVRYIEISKSSVSVRSIYHQAIALTRLDDIRGIDRFVNIVENNLQHPNHKHFYSMTSIWFLRCMFKDIRNREDLQPGQEFWGKWWRIHRPQVKHIFYPKVVSKYLSYCPIFESNLEEDIKYLTDRND